MEKPSPEKRTIARLVLCLAVLILGVAAAVRLDLAYLPSWSLPELSVRLRLPETGEITEVTEAWAMPLESAVRAVGDVTSMAGWVDVNGANYQVRFRAGTNPERKAGRLESELSALRRELPQGASLAVLPSGQGGGQQAMMIWVDDAAGRSGRALVEALRALPEVRNVFVAGEKQRELRVVPRAGVDPARVSRTLREHQAVHRLGEVVAGGRRLPVFSANGGGPFDDVLLRSGETVLPLAALADVALREEDPWINVRLESRPGLVYLLDREIDTSPLLMERAVERTLRRHLGEASYHLLFNEAEPLRVLVQRLLLGVAAATLLGVLLALALGGGRMALTQALALPVALAAALNACVVAGVDLDSTTLPMLAVGLAFSLFFPAYRAAGGGAWTAAATVAAAAVALPVGVALAAGRLAPLFAPPARAFVCAQLGALVALWLVPLPAGGRFHGYFRVARGGPRWRPARLGGPLRAALRHPGTVLLATVTATYVLLVLFSGTLEPQPSRNLRPASTDLRVFVRFAEGATLEQATAQVAVAEETLRRHESVTTWWSYYNDGYGVVQASVERSERSPQKLRRLADRLQHQLHSLGAAAQVTPLASGSGGGSGGGGQVRFSDSIEDEAETDKDATFYTFVLRATDLDVLRRAHAIALDRLLGHPFIEYRDVTSDWGRPSTRVELRPRPGTTPAQGERALQQVQEQAFLPRARELPSVQEVSLRVVGREAPEDADTVRQRHRLLGRPPDAESGSALVPGELLEMRDVVTPPAVKRQGGRYVLPVTIRFSGLLRRMETRRSADVFLRYLALPAGCDIELPSINRFTLSAAQRRLLWIASALPLLLAVLAVCRLNSLRVGLLALVPGALGVVASTPWIRATSGAIDEVSLLVLAAAVAGSTPLAVMVLAAARRQGEAGQGEAGQGDGAGRDYHWLAAHTPAFLVASAGMTALLLVPGIGLESARHPWAPPLRLAALAGFFAVLASYLCLASLLRSASWVRRRGERREARQAVVRHWREEGRLELDVHGVTKVYGNGFKALAGVDFHLEPGIIGLLGPNGAGKTTLLRILCGILEPSRGLVTYRGHRITSDNLPEYRKLVGFLPQDFNAYEGFTGLQFLDYWALEKGILDPAERRREIEHRIAQVGLEDAAERKVRDFSGGMRRRIGIARALIGDPPIVIVDEPTTGLDVASRNRLRESLLKVAGERIILFSTHIASDVAAAAARILLLHRGRMLYDGPARGLVDKAQGAVFETTVDDKDLRAFSKLYRVTTRVRETSGVRVRAVAPGGDVPADAEVVTPNLEEAYLAVIDAAGGARDGREMGAASLLDLSAKRVA